MLPADTRVRWSLPPAKKVSNRLDTYVTVPRSFAVRSSAWYLRNPIQGSDEAVGCHG